MDMPKLSLRSVLIFPYVILIVCLAIAIGFLSYGAGGHAVQTVSNHLLEETVSRISQAIDRHVMGSVATLEVAFPDGMLADSNIQTNVEEMRTRFWTASSLHLDPNNYVYYGNKAGQALGLYRYSNDKGELRVKYQPQEHRKFYELDGINGIPRLTSIEEKNFDPRVRPWFHAGSSNNSDTWTSVYIDFRTHDLIATRARQVLGLDGQFEGVVATDMSLKSLNDFVSNLNVSENGIAFIIEPDGQLIASSQSENIKRNQEGENTRVNAGQSGNALLSEIYSQMVPLISAKVASFKPETFRFTDELQREIHVAYNKFEDGVGLEWINVVAMPSSDFMGGIKNNVVQTILIGVLATSLVVLIGLMILQWVTKDLKILSNAVNSVSSGHIEEPINIQRNDEIGDLAKSFSAMQRRLHSDYLTGLPNRYAFEQHLKAKIKKYDLEIEKSPFAILFIDLNDFKKINDVYGHDVGDQVLIEFAVRMYTTIREHDLAARFAGDEFVIVVNDIKRNEELDIIISNLKQTLSEPLNSFDNPIASLGGSIGVAHYPDDGNTVEQLLVVADRNMYVDKAEIKEENKTS
ncbi:diguanylate cyclase domain-containing protein [Vibrio sp. RC27]